MSDSLDPVRQILAEAGSARHPSRILAEALLQLADELLDLRQRVGASEAEHARHYGVLIGHEERLGILEAGRTAQARADQSLLDVANIVKKLVGMTKELNGRIDTLVDVIRNIDGRVAGLEEL